MADDKIFDESNQVKSQWVKWGKPGDFFKGTLLRKSQRKSTFPGKEGQLEWSYEFKAKGGSFHDIDENGQPTDTVITIKDGEIWSVGGRKSIDGALRNMNPGQIVGLKFTELVPPKQKGFNPTKVVKVYDGGEDPDYMGEEGDDINAADIM